MGEPSPTPLRILILGGTSFLGIHMTEIALQRGHTLTHFNRGRTHPDLFPMIERLTGDREGDLRNLAWRSWDAVIDNCGYVPRHVRHSAGILAPRVHHYLFVSTISVYADFTRPNDEDSALAPLTDPNCEEPAKAYGALKALCETAAQAALPGRTLIVRPGLIVGPHDPTDRFTYWPVRAARGDELLVPGDPDTPIQVIDARDLARFCIGALETGLTGTFNATSDTERFTMGDLIAGSVAAAFDLASPYPPPRPVWVSPEFVEQQHVQPWSELPVWFPPTGAMAALHRTRVDRALAAGLAITPLERTLQDTLRWHLGRPKEERSKLRAGLTPERERELLNQWHAQTR